MVGNWWYNPSNLLDRCVKEGAHMQKLFEELLRENFRFGRMCFLYISTHSITKGNNNYVRL